MVRDPVPEPVAAGQHAHVQYWHREGGGAANPLHPLCIHTVMVLFYLDDSVDETSHGFCVVPESLRAKKAHRLARSGQGWIIDEPFAGRTKWIHARRADSVAVHGAAGTAVVTRGRGSTSSSTAVHGLPPPAQPGGASSLMQ
jgi:hypothetical protein